MLQCLYNFFCIRGDHEFLVGRNDIYLDFGSFSRQVYDLVLTDNGLIQLGIDFDAEIVHITADPFTQLRVVFAQSGCEYDRV